MGMTVLFFFHIFPHLLVYLFTLPGTCTIRRVHFLRIVHEISSAWCCYSPLFFIASDERVLLARFLRFFLLCSPPRSWDEGGNNGGYRIRTANTERQGTRTSFSYLIVTINIAKINLEIPNLCVVAAARRKQVGTCVHISDLRPANNVFDAHRRI